MPQITAADARRLRQLAEQADAGRLSPAAKALVAAVRELLPTHPVGPRLQVDVSQAQALRQQGHSFGEIAARLGCSRSTAERAAKRTPKTY